MKTKIIIASILLSSCGSLFPANDGSENQNYMYQNKRFPYAQNHSYKNYKYNPPMNRMQFRQKLKGDSNNYNQSGSNQANIGMPDFKPSYEYQQQSGNAGKIPAPVVRNQQANPYQANPYQANPYQANPYQANPYGGMDYSQQQGGGYYQPEYNQQQAPYQGGGNYYPSYDNQQQGNYYQGGNESYAPAPQNLNYGQSPMNPYANMYGQPPR